MTTIVHCMEEPFDIYIGRPHPRFPEGSKWANPFVIDKDGTREECIAKYRKWVPTQKNLMTSLKELQGRVLGCWCKSRKGEKPCHGDALVDLLKENKMYLGAGESYIGQTKGPRENIVPGVRSSSDFIIPQNQTIENIIRAAGKYGISFRIENNTVVAKADKGSIPWKVKLMIRDHHNQLKAVIGGCKTCGAMGVINNAPHCYHDVFFRGKAVKGTKINLQGKNACPVKLIRL